MGLFSDLAMGLGLKDRDADYYERTAKTIGRNDGAAAEARYRQGRAYTEQPTRGGPAAMVGNILDRREGGQRGGWGYGEGDQRVSALRDMLDGGGRGRAGQRFEGGLLADLANALGFRPLGYQERLAAAPTMASPTRPAAPAAPNWAAAQEGMALEGQRLPLGATPASPLSFGGGGAMPDWANFVGTSPLAFGSPREIPSPRRVNMPTAPQGMIPYDQMNAAIRNETEGLTDYIMRLRNPPSAASTTTSPYGNIRGTGTGGGGYGYPVVGAYTF